MKSLKAIGLGLLGSMLTGLVAGLAWKFGNKAANAGTLQLVLLSVPANLVTGFLFYLVVRGCVALGGGGVGLLVVNGIVNLFVTLAIGAFIAEVIGSGVGQAGAHAFSWGMAYAYAQAFYDVKDSHGARFGG